MKYSAEDARRIRRRWAELRPTAWSYFNAGREIFNAALPHEGQGWVPGEPVPEPGAHGGIVLTFVYKRTLTYWQVTCGDIMIEQGPR